MNNSLILELTAQLTQALDQNYDVVNMDTVLAVISALEGATITKEQLETTRLAKHINQFRRRTKINVLAIRAKNLLKKWREMFGITSQAQSEGTSAPTENAQPTQQHIPRPLITSSSSQPVSPYSNQLLNESYDNSLSIGGVMDYNRIGTSANCISGGVGNRSGGGGGGGSCSNPPGSANYSTYKKYSTGSLSGEVVSNRANGALSDTQTRLTKSRGIILNNSPAGLQSSNPPSSKVKHPTSFKNLISGFNTKQMNSLSPKLRVSANEGNSEGRSHSTTYSVDENATNLRTASRAPVTRSATFGHRTASAGLHSSSRTHKSAKRKERESPPPPPLPPPQVNFLKEHSPSPLGFDSTSQEPGRESQSNRDPIIISTIDINDSNSNSNFTLCDLTESNTTGRMALSCNNNSSSKKTKKDKKRSKERNDPIAETEIFQPNIDESSRIAFPISGVQDYLSLSNSSMSIFPSQQITASGENDRYHRNITGSNFDNKGLTSSASDRNGESYGSDLTFAGKFKQTSNSSGTDIESSSGYFPNSDENLVVSASEFSCGNMKAALTNCRDSIPVNSTASNSSTFLPFHRNSSNSRTSQLDLTDANQDSGSMITVDDLRQPAQSSLDKNRNRDLDNIQKPSNSSSKQNSNNPDQQKIPKKRGRKKGSKGVDSVIAQSGSLSSQFLMGPALGSTKKVKTTMELLADIQNRKLGSSATSSPTLMNWFGTSRPASSCSEPSLHSPRTSDACSTQATTSTAARLSPDKTISNNSVAADEFYDSDTDSDSSEPSCDSVMLVVPNDQAKSLNATEFEENAVAVVGGVPTLSIEEQIKNIMSLLPPVKLEDIDWEAYEDVPCTCTIREVKPEVKCEPEPPQQIEEPPQQEEKKRTNKKNLIIIESVEIIRPASNVVGTFSFAPSIAPISASTMDTIPVPASTSESTSSSTAIASKNISKENEETVISLPPPEKPQPLILWSPNDSSLPAQLTADTSPQSQPSPPPPLLPGSAALPISSASSSSSTAAATTTSSSSRPPVVPSTNPKPMKSIFDLDFDDDNDPLHHFVEGGKTQEQTECSSPIRIENGKTEETNTDNLKVPATKPTKPNYQIIKNDTNQQVQTNTPSSQLPAVSITISASSSSTLSPSPLTSLQPPKQQAVLPSPPPPPPPPPARPARPQLPPHLQMTDTASIASEPPPVYEVVEDPNCLAKLRYVTQVNQITKFHIDAMHNFFIPYVNGNWDNSEPRDVDQDTANDQNESSSLVNVVPKYGCFVNQRIPKDLSHIKYKSHFVKPRRTRNNKRDEPFRGVANWRHRFQRYRRRYFRSYKRKAVLRRRRRFVDIDARQPLLKDEGKCARALNARVTSQDEYRYRAVCRKEEKVIITLCSKSTQCRLVRYNKRFQPSRTVLKRCSHLCEGDIGNSIFGELLSTSEINSWDCPQDNYTRNNLDQSKNDRLVDNRRSRRQQYEMMKEYKSKKSSSKLCTVDNRRHDNEQQNIIEDISNSQRNDIAGNLKENKEDCLINEQQESEENLSKDPCEVYKNDISSTQEELTQTVVAKEDPPDVGDATSEFQLQDNANTATQIEPDDVSPSEHIKIIDDTSSSKSPSDHEIQPEIDLDNNEDETDPKNDDETNKIEVIHEKILRANGNILHLINNNSILDNSEDDKCDIFNNTLNETITNNNNSDSNNKDDRDENTITQSRRSSSCSNSSLKRNQNSINMKLRKHRLQQQQEKQQHQEKERRRRKVQPNIVDIFDSGDNHDTEYRPLIKRIKLVNGSYETSHRLTYNSCPEDDCDSDGNRSCSEQDRDDAVTDDEADEEYDDTNNHDADADVDVDVDVDGDPDADAEDDDEDHDNDNDDHDEHDNDEYDNEDDEDNDDAEDTENHYGEFHEVVTRDMTSSTTGNKHIVLTIKKTPSKTNSPSSSSMSPALVGALCNNTKLPLISPLHAVLDSAIDNLLISENSIGLSTEPAEKLFKEDKYDEIHKYLDIDTSSAIDIGAKSDIFRHGANDIDVYNISLNANAIDLSGDDFDDIGIPQNPDLNIADLVPNDNQDGMVGFHFGDELDDEMEHEDDGQNVSSNFEAVHHGDTDSNDRSVSEAESNSNEERDGDSNPSQEEAEENDDNHEEQEEHDEQDDEEQGVEQSEEQGEDGSVHYQHEHAYDTPDTNYDNSGNSSNDVGSNSSTQDNEIAVESTTNTATTTTALRTSSGVGTDPIRVETNTRSVAAMSTSTGTDADDIPDTNGRIVMATIGAGNISDTTTGNTGTTEKCSMSTNTISTRTVRSANTDTATRCSMGVGTDPIILPRTHRASHSIGTGTESVGIGTSNISTGTGTTSTLAVHRSRSNANTRTCTTETQSTEIGVGTSTCSTSTDTGPSRSAGVTRHTVGTNTTLKLIFSTTASTSTDFDEPNLPPTYPIRPEDRPPNNPPIVIEEYDSDIELEEELHMNQTEIKESVKVRDDVKDFSTHVDRIRERLANNRNLTKGTDIKLQRFHDPANKEGFILADPSSIERSMEIAKREMKRQKLGHVLKHGIEKAQKHHRRLFMPDELHTSAGDKILEMQSCSSNCSDPSHSETDVSDFETDTSLESEIRSIKSNLLIRKRKLTPFPRRSKLVYEGRRGRGGGGGGDPSSSSSSSGDSSSNDSSGSEFYMESTTDTSSSSDEEDEDDDEPYLKRRKHRSDADMLPEENNYQLRSFNHIYVSTEERQRQEELKHAAATAAAAAAAAVEYRRVNIVNPGYITIDGYDYRDGENPESLEPNNSNANCDVYVNYFDNHPNVNRYSSNDNNDDADTGDIRSPATNDNMDVEVDNKLDAVEPLSSNGSDEASARIPAIMDDPLSEHADDVAVPEAGGINQFDDDSNSYCIISHNYNSNNNRNNGNISNHNRSVLLDENMEHEILVVREEYRTGLRQVDEDVDDEDGNNCARMQQFKEWHEVLQLRSYNDELLTVLPYVVIE